MSDSIHSGCHFSFFVACLIPCVHRHRLLWVGDLYKGNFSSFVSCFILPLLFHSQLEMSSCCAVSRILILMSHVFFM